MQFVCVLGVEGNIPVSVDMDKPYCARGSKRTRTSSGISLHLLPRLRQGLLLATVHARLAGSLASVSELS